MVFYPKADMVLALRLADPRVELLCTLTQLVDGLAMD